MFLVTPLVAMIQIARSMCKDLTGVALFTVSYLREKGWLGLDQARVCETREDSVHIIYLLKVYLGSLYTIHCAPISAVIVSMLLYFLELNRKAIHFCFSACLIIFLSYDMCLVPLTIVFEVMFWSLICFVPPPQPPGLPPDRSDHHWKAPLLQAPSGYMVPRLTPFPSRYLILTGLCLLQAFIGYLTKFGANFMGAVAQVANCASNLAYLVVFRSKKTRETANKTCKCRVKRIGKEEKRIGHVAWRAQRRMHLLAVMFVVTLAMNSVIISVQGFKYVKKSIPRPKRKWMRYSRPFKAEDTRPCIVALPAYLAEEGEIHGVYAEWDDSCDHVVLDSGSTHTILSEEKFFVWPITPTNAQIIGATGPGPADGEGTTKFSIIDDHGEKFNVIQKKALLSKKLGKNLVGIFALNLQYGEEYFRLSTVGNKSLLTWGHEKYKKHFMHHPLCPISEMAVNEGEHVGFCAFVEKFVPKKIYSFLAPSTMQSVFHHNDKDQDDATTSTNDSSQTNKKISPKFSNDASQISDIHEALEDPMFCVECEPDKNREVYYRWMPDTTQQKIVLLQSESVNENGVKIARVRVLNTDNVISLPKTSLTPIDLAEPTTIPVTKNDVDQAAASLEQAKLTKEGVHKLWNPGTAFQ